MDILELPGKWIKAKCDLGFDFYSLSETNETPKKIKVKTGQDFQVYAAIKSAYGNSKLILIRYEENSVIPVEFDPKYWDLI